MTVKDSDVRQTPAGITYHVAKLLFSTSTTIHRQTRSTRTSVNPVAPCLLENKSPTSTLSSPYLNAIDILVFRDDNPATTNDPKSTQRTHSSERRTSDTLPSCRFSTECFGNAKKERSGTDWQGQDFRRRSAWSGCPRQGSD